jgi:hypothetical protein
VFADLALSHLIIGFIGNSLGPSVLAQTLKGSQLIFRSKQGLDQLLNLFHNLIRLILDILLPTRLARTPGLSYALVFLERRTGFFFKCCIHYLPILGLGIIDVRSDRGPITDNPIQAQRSVSSHSTSGSANNRSFFKR